MGYFTACFDASGHPSDQPFVIVSGYVANYQQWKAFNAMWVEEHKRAGVDLPFHMAEFNSRRSGKRQDYKKLTEEEALCFILNLATLQQSFMVLAIGCMVKMSDYDEINSVLDLKSVVPPYALGARACISRLAQWQRDYGIPEAVECIFEDGDFGKGKFMDLMRVDGLPAPIFKGKSSFPGLQAADYLAWETNRHAKNISVNPSDQPRITFSQLLTTIPHLYAQATKEDLIRLCEAKDIKHRILKR